MLVLTIHFRKGGTSKSTSSQHIAATASLYEGLKTLLIDTDGQANISKVFGVESNGDKGLVRCMRSVLRDNIPNLSDETVTVRENLDLLPGSVELFQVQNEIANYDGNRVKLLASVLQVANGLGYDLIVIDTPPSDGWLVKNAIFAADRLIAPIVCNAFSMDGIVDFNNELLFLGRKFEKDIKLFAFVPCVFDKRIKEQNEYLAMLHKKFDPKVTKVRINIDANIAKAQTENMTIFEFKPNSRASFEYQELTRELLV